MTVQLNKRAYDHARHLIVSGKFVVDGRDDWSEHQPTAAQENEYLQKHGYREYGRWYLGVDDSKPEDTKGHYRFPYGDFENVHRCGLLAVESRAEQYDHHDIGVAAAHLHGMLDAKRA
jgi:hypothetical protein